MIILFIYKRGTAMGTSYLFMAEWEDPHILSKLEEDLVLWHRYIDNIFFIWNKTEEDLLKFLTHINTNSMNLPFSSNYSNIQVEFLDLTIRIETNKIICSTYQKPISKNSHILF